MHARSQRHGRRPRGRPERLDRRDLRHGVCVCTEEDIADHPARPRLISSLVTCLFGRQGVPSRSDQEDRLLARQHATIYVRVVYSSAVKSRSRGTEINK